MHDNDVTLPDVQLPHGVCETLSGGDFVGEFRALLREFVEIEENGLRNPPEDVILSWLEGGGQIGRVEKAHVFWLLFDKLLQFLGFNQYSISEMLCGKISVQLTEEHGPRVYCQRKAFPDCFEHYNYYTT
jgi:hypothetical protein